MRVLLCCNIFRLVMICMHLEMMELRDRCYGEKETTVF